MNAKITVFFLAAIALFGCTQEQASVPGDFSPPQGNSLQPLNLDGFKLEFTSIGKAGMLTMLFEKDSITKIEQMPDNVRQMQSKPISQKQFEDLAKTVNENRFFNMQSDEYGEFSETDGPTYVVEAALDGKEKIVSCQLNCPQEIQNIRQKVEPFIEN